MKTFLAVLLLATATVAQSAKPENSAAAKAEGTKASPGIPRGNTYTAQFLTEHSVDEMHLIQLAEAIPQEKYAWRPAQGVRSVGEVFMHLAAANFNLPKLIGTPPPADVKLDKSFETSLTDKAQIIAMLKRSFAHSTAAVEKLTDADKDKTFPWFGGSQNTYAGWTYFMMRHTAEHTGQLISYARMNNITPPWNEEGAREQAPAPPKPKVEKK